MVEILIVGGGIGGAVLALALGRHRIECCLLERETSAPDSSAPAFGRPEILWSPTLESLDPLGVGEAIRGEAAIALRGLEIREPPRRDGTTPLLLHIEEGDIEAAGIRPWSTDPSRTRALILEHALATGHVRLERGVLARGLRKDAGSVVVEGVRNGEDPIEFRGRVVVGDDGGRSVIRSAAGIELEVQDVPVEFMGALMPRPVFVPPAEVRGWVNPTALGKGLAGAAWAALPRDRAAMVLIAAPEATERWRAGDSSSFSEDLRALVPPAVALGETLDPARLGHFRRPVGHAESYVADRVALIGDAVHPVTPAGGQGANMAIADALALAEVLSDCLRADTLDAASLRPYEKRRRPANERAVGFSRELRRVVDLARRTPFLLAPVLSLVRRADRHPEQKQAALRQVGTAFLETS